MEWKSYFDFFLLDSRIASSVLKGVKKHRMKYEHAKKSICVFVKTEVFFLMLSIS